MHSTLNERDARGRGLRLHAGARSTPLPGQNPQQNSFMTSQNSLSFALIQFHSFHKVSVLWGTSVIYLKAIQFLLLNLLCEAHLRVTACSTKMLSYTLNKNFWYETKSQVEIKRCCSQNATV